MSAGQLLLVLLVAALKAGLLLALAAGLVAALRRAPARARHSIWAGALAGALLVPLLSPWLPDWTITALPAPALAGEPAGRVVRQTRPPRPLPSAGPVASIATEIPADARVGGPAAAVEVAAGDAVWRSRLGGVLPASWLLGGWLLGCLVSFACFLRALGAARRLELRADSADASWRLDLARARRRVGLPRRVRLLLSSETPTPITWGWLRPVVVLPARSSGWDGERRRIVLEHELLHVKRADWLVRLLARLVCSLYWPNPLAWMAARRLAVEQEMACDEEVVALGTRPSSYAWHLLAIARAPQAAAALPAHALDMARRSQMEGRLMSILDGKRQSRGGRLLAVPALLLIAGLVPALAAIEPWVQEQAPPGPSWSGGSAGAAPAAETAAVARVLGELEELDRQMEPFEAELAELEVEMAPIERELEAIGVEMEPVEVELEGFETELEPFEQMLEAVEVEMEPHLAHLETLEVELEPFEERLQALEVELGPFEEQLEAIEVEMEPFEERLEEIEVELEPFEEQLESLSEQMEPLAREGGESSAELQRLAESMQQVQQRMAPLRERMSAVHQEMEPLYERMSRVHGDMEPLHRRMAAVHDEMAPVFERMAATHQELEPLYGRLSEVHERMEPVFERMGAAHEWMSPFHDSMGEQHERMEPYRQKMSEIHERMRPLYEAMEQRHLELERELAALVEHMLARQLAGVTAAGTDFAPVAARIADAVSLRVDDGTLRVVSAPPRIREIVSQSLGGQITASDPQFAAALDRFVRALGDLSVEAR